ncbi:ribonuclease Z [Candidatus Pacearchaeota archaeon]|nr:ribonuclease Z [Candidatus Pacearchaeota archaeon]
MEPITLTFLGTGNAVPTELRSHTGIFLSYKDEQILVDCGEGIQRQFRYAKLSPTKITRLLITHWHGDHILGIPGLLQTLAMSDYQRKLMVYGPAGTKKFFSLIEELLLHIRIPIEIHEVKEGTIVHEKEFFIEAKPMSHGIPSCAYSFNIKKKTRLDKRKIQKLKLPNSPILGQLQNGHDIIFNGKKIKAKDITYTEEGRKVTFILDTEMNQNAVEIAKDSDLIIAESTFAIEEEERAKEYKHLTAGQAANIAKKAKAKSLILTHISQRYEHAPQIIEKQAKKIFKNTRIAKDLDTIVV